MFLAALTFAVGAAGLGNVDLVKRSISMAILIHSKLSCPPPADCFSQQLSLPSTRAEGLLSRLDDATSASLDWGLQQGTILTHHLNGFRGAIEAASGNDAGRWALTANSELRSGNSMPRKALVPIW